MTTCYKFLREDGTSTHADCAWNLPDGDTPGEWMPEINESLEICETGYHAVDRNHALAWLNDRLYEVELGGEIIHEEDKYAGSKARLVKHLSNWNERTERLFAADCAAFALKFAQTDDPRPVKAIEVARLFADGKATADELATARAAAWDAARAAAWDAARATARSAARDTAWDAAWDAAWAAAWDVAWDAAWDVLTLRFWEYVESDTTPEPWGIGFDAIAHYKKGNDQ